MWHVIGLFVTVASVAGVAVIYEGATDAARRLRAYVHARRAKPSREGETDASPNQYDEEDK
jgi:hypothetical protein